MNNYKCYAIIDKDTNKFLKPSYKLYVPFYSTSREAKNALRGYNTHYRVNKNGYKIVEITINDENIKIIEEK